MNTKTNEIVATNAAADDTAKTARIHAPIKTWQDVVDQLLKLSPGERQQPAKIVREFLGANQIFELENLNNIQVSGILALEFGDGVDESEAFTATVKTIVITLNETKRDDLLDAVYVYLEEAEEATGVAIGEFDGSEEKWNEDAEEGEEADDEGLRHMGSYQIEVKGATAEECEERYQKIFEYLTAKEYELGIVGFYETARKSY